MSFLYRDVATSFPYTVETAAEFNDHLCTVWRVAWNITGTVLSSSGDDGCVRLWKGMSKNNTLYINLIFH